MRLAWFTPFSTQSAIGEFSRHVTAALAQHAAVDIWTAERGPLRESDLRVVCFAGEDDLEARLGDYDTIVYNMGNYPPFHRDIHVVSKRHPGIVILHDRVLHHLFALDTWRRQGGSMDPTYVARMRTYYGEDGARAARRSISGRLPVWEHDHEVVKYPLDEEALQGALGAVTHTYEHARYLQARWLGPVRALQHPAYGHVLAKGASAAAGPPQRRDDGRIQLTTVGHVNANKHSDSVIRILAADAELATMVHYTIVGPIDEGNAYAGHLRELIRSVPHVSAEMLGWCDEHELDRLMAATDVFINLRHPVMESGSGTLMRELAFGRAVLCFNDGCFGELPTGASARVAAGDFGAAASLLRRLVTDADSRRMLGEHGRRVALERGEPEYAEGLIEFMDEVRRATPALRLLDRVAGELGAMGADPSLPVFEAIANDFARVLVL